MKYIFVKIGDLYFWWLINAIGLKTMLEFIYRKITENMNPERI
jgi:hypothetical protein